MCSNMTWFEPRLATSCLLQNLSISTILTPCQIVLFHRVCYPNFPRRLRQRRLRHFGCPSFHALPLPDALSWVYRYLPAASACRRRHNHVQRRRRDAAGARHRLHRAGGGDGLRAGACALRELHLTCAPEAQPGEQTSMLSIPIRTRLHLAPKTRDSLEARSGALVELHLACASATAK